MFHYYYLLLIGQHPQLFTQQLQGGELPLVELPGHRGRPGGAGQGLLPGQHVQDAGGRGVQPGPVAVVATVSPWHGAVAVHILKDDWQGVRAPVQVPAGHREVWEGGEVLGPPDGLADCTVMGVLHLETAQGRLLWVGHCEEALRESTQAVAVVDTGKVLSDHVPESESVEELVPKEDVLGTQLGYVAVGLGEEVLLALDCLDLDQPLHPLPAVERPGHLRPLEVRQEATEVGQLALQGLEGLQQQRADLLVDPAGYGEPGAGGAVLHPQLCGPEQDRLHGGEAGRGGAGGGRAPGGGPGGREVGLVQGEQGAVDCHTEGSGAGVGAGAGA